MDVTELIEELEKALQYAEKNFGKESEQYKIIETIRNEVPDGKLSFVKLIDVDGVSAPLAPIETQLHDTLVDILGTEFTA